MMTQTIGILGLGKMGKHMALRLLTKKKNVVVWNRSSAPMQEVVAQGAVGADSIEHLIAQLPTPRVVWLMLPHEVVGEYIETIRPLLQKGDVIVDGGNSNFKLSMQRFVALSKEGIEFVDVGVSGGLAAANIGYCAMAGGTANGYALIEPFLEALCVENGFGHMGSAGSGHYVKMVHNAVEYGMMQSIAEGFNLMKHGTFSDLDLSHVAKVWQNGSIVRSFLIDLVADALQEDSTLSSFPGAHISDSGEGRWSAVEAIDHGVPFVANTYAVHARFASRDTDSYAAKMLAAMRKGFGGHVEK